MLTLALTPDQIVTLVTAANLRVDFGAELLDANDQVIEDISEDLAGGEVEHNNFADVHGTCSLQLSRELDWNTARVRPYQTLTAEGLTKTWPLGVFLLTTPETPLGENPKTYTVAGYDKLHLLQKPVGDTYFVATGTGYLVAVAQVITAAGYTGVAPFLDGTAVEKTLAAPMVWVLDTKSPTRYIDVVNALLSAIGYRGLYADASGRFRSEPYQSPAIRPPVWTFDLGDSRTQIVGERRTLTTDGFTQTNWWRFIRTGQSVAPTEGSGMYTVDLSAGGTKVKSVTERNAADQASLEAAGDVIVQAAQQVTRTLEITTGPWPVAGHLDVVQYKDPAGAMDHRCEVRSWRMPLDGKSDMSLTLEVL